MCYVTSTSAARLPDEISNEEIVTEDVEIPDNELDGIGECECNCEVEE